MSEHVDVACRVCKSVIANEPFEVREHYFGGTGSHRYVECDACGTIQMVVFPSDIEAIYPPLYRPKFRVPGPVRRLLLRQRANFVRGARWNLLGKALTSRYGTPEWAEWMSHTGASLDSRILDVGSSDGELVVALSAAGYRDVTGIDPYIAHDRSFAGGARVLKRRLEDHEGVYDLIMLHHSLEHMPDPIDGLSQTGRLLANDGWVLVRVPVAGTYGWRTYREHWFGLEPPRHLVIPSEKGMELIATAAGFAIVRTVYDGHGGYYAMGEAALAGRDMSGPRRPSQQRAAEIYDEAELRRFRMLAAERNAAGDGDTAAFYLRR
jgi:SAM-dependent methyltransferase